MSPIRKSVITAVSAIAGLSFAASLARSVEVQGRPSAVWALIGPFCAIQEWLPPVGSCKQNHSIQLPVRTLVTKDGTATFVERQIERDDARHFYSYTFLSSPLPVRNYTSTIWVTSVGHGRSMVAWRSTYTPLPGKERAAREALDGIYTAGLDSIQARAKQKVARVARAAP
jgi:hypothetical protein